MTEEQRARDREDRAAQTLTEAERERRLAQVDRQVQQNADRARNGGFPW